jgi:hypothetical protein
MADWRISIDRRIEIDRRLELAKEGDHRYQPQENVWFAWFPVRLGPWGDGPKRWLCFVRRFKPLGLYWEYYDLGKGGTK